MSAKCPRWTTPNGSCPADALPSGQHVCGVDVATHAKCRCACGVETLRPAGDREVARYEERQRQVSINVGPGGRGTVVVAGVDIANLITSATVELRGMQPTSVTLGMEAVRVVAEANGELDEVTAGALLGLGWGSPEFLARLEQGDHARRAAMQDALGGLGSVLRNWDELIGLVQEQTHRLEGLDK